MAIELKTLSTGLLRTLTTATTVVFQPGGSILYAAPNPADFPAVGATKAALVTKMAFFNRNPVGAAAVTINVYFVRFDASKGGALRPKRRILPVNLSLVSGQVVTDQVPLTLEPGDAILGDTTQINVIDFAINGFERLVV